MAVALKASLQGYCLSTFRQDFLAAFVVSLLALPLSMALAIAVGMPPQYGLYTAIIAGVVVPLLGGSNWQVSGPTAAFVVILAPIVSEFGPRGIIWAGLLAGVMLVLMGWARLGKLIHYIPYPVTTGFTAGIAVVLAILSLNDFLGLRITRLEGGTIAKIQTIAAELSNIDLYTAGIGMIALFLLFTTGRLIRWLPSAVIAVLVGTMLSFYQARAGHEIDTIGSRFSYVAVDGRIESGIPPYPPSFHMPNTDQGNLFTIPDFEELRTLLFPALAIALLAALESLLSATVADSMAGTRHEPNAELGAIGIGNILTALTGGIAATGAIARTAALINNGARTPIASSLHAIMILAYMVLFAPYISYIPMTVLAALLIHTAWRMSHIHQCIRIIRIAPRSDVLVLATCFSLTVLVDMVIGVGVGMVCAAFLLIKHVSQMTEAVVYGPESETPPAMLEEPLPEGTFLYRIQGPIFFATIERAFEQYRFIHDHVERVIIDMSEVPFIDMSGLVALRSMLASMTTENRAVQIVCPNNANSNRIRLKLADYQLVSSVRIFSSLSEALSHQD